MRSYARPLRARASKRISDAKLRLMEKGLSAADVVLGVAFGGFGTSCAELRENDEIVRARLRALTADRRRLTAALKSTREALAEGRARRERLRDQRRRRVGGLRNQPVLEQGIDDAQEYIDRLTVLDRIGETALKRVTTAERSLLAVEDAIGKALVEFCDPANQPTPAVEDFFGTWRHGNKTTYACVILRGEPEQYTEVTYSGGPKAPLNGVVQRQRLDSAGRGVAKFLINTAGSYRFTPQWEGDDGKLHFKPSNNAFDQVATINVANPPTNGPPPPADYASVSCPAPQG